MIQLYEDFALAKKAPATADYGLYARRWRAQSCECYGLFDFARLLNILSEEFEVTEEAWTI